MPHGIVHRSELIADGQRPEVIDEDVRSDRLVWVGRRLYTDPQAMVDAYTQRLAVLVARAGSKAAASHRSAARLHQLDGFRESQIVEVVTTHSNGLRLEGVHRTRHLPDEHLTIINDVRVTTLARTLRDLGAIVGADVVEVASESAFRGPDPKRPHEWNVALLDELTALATHLAPRTGVTNLRIALDRRGANAMPTGSIAETFALQGMRRQGVRDVIRQADLRIFSPSGRLRHHYYADLFEVLTATAVEVNGAIAHGGAVMDARDVDRHNELSRFIRVLVFPATRALNDPDGLGREVKREVEQSQKRDQLWTVPAGVVVRTATGLDLFER